MSPTSLKTYPRSSPFRSPEEVAAEASRGTAGC